MLKTHQSVKSVKPFFSQGRFIAQEKIIHMLENYILIILKFEAGGRISYNNKLGLSSQSTQQISLEKARLQISKCSD